MKNDTIARALRECSGKAVDNAKNLFANGAALGVLSPTDIIEDRAFGEELIRCGALDNIAKEMPLKRWNLSNLRRLIALFYQCRLQCQVRVLDEALIENDFSKALRNVVCSFFCVDLKPILTIVIATSKLEKKFGRRHDAISFISYVLKSRTGEEEIPD